MKFKLFKKTIFLFLFSGLFFTNTGYAQLNKVFENIFNGFLIDDLELNSIGIHGMHFRLAAETANAELTPALNSLIANNVSSFPLSATAAGVTFDFAQGRPVSVTESLGPIFAETAETLGKGKFNIGFNYTHLSLQKLRGLSTKDMRFTFIHEDTEPPGLGEPFFENDTIDLLLDLHVSADIFAFFATAGILRNLDFGVVIPLVNVSLNGNPQAVVNSFSFASSGSAFHIFGGTFNDPDLDQTRSYDESAFGVGDIGLRLKYSILRGAGVDLAALLDVRLPTGEENDFLGTGNLNFKFTWIMSTKFGDFTPHLNIGYDKRLADFDSDEFELTFGFDQKVTSGVSFAFELMGEFDLNNDEAIDLFSGSETLTALGTLLREIDKSNVPEKDDDHTVNAAFGFRVAPSEKFSLLANILIPLNDGGLRPNFATTVGLNIIL